MTKARFYGAAEVLTLEIMSDASGAPATVRRGSYVFAFDTLGEIKANLIAPVCGSRASSKIALESCRIAYKAARDASIDADWLHRNREMYKGDEA